MRDVEDEVREGEREVGDKSDQHDSSFHCPSCDAEDDGYAEGRSAEVPRQMFAVGRVEVDGREMVEEGARKELGPRAEDAFEEAQQGEAETNQGSHRVSRN